jgi:hypothetical protein
MLGQKEEKAKATDPVAQNTKRAADALEEIKTKMIGGGQRTQGSISRFEAEVAISRALRLGYG